jgi:hypothetical protein
MLSPSVARSPDRSAGHAWSRGRRGERVRPTVHHPPVRTFSPKKVDDVQRQDDVAIVPVDRLVGVGKRVVGPDRPQLGQIDGRGCPVQHAAVAVCVSALGVPVPWTHLVIVYGATLGAASLSFTPAGIGIVESAIAVALSATQ